MESGDAAWMLISTALVVFMVPGLALFYGGMVRAKNVGNMLMMNMAAIAVAPVLWVLFTYSLGNSGNGDGESRFFGGDLIGNFDAIGLDGISGTDLMVMKKATPTGVALRSGRGRDLHVRHPPEGQVRL
jgi:Amt family ammonium transporter